MPHSRLQGLEGEYFVLEEDAEDPELNPRPVLLTWA